jgi:aminoglycoside 3-N-acetyltransferase I
MEITKLNAEDITSFVELISIFKEVFENDNAIPQEKYLSKLLENPDFFVIVAKHNHEIVGGLTVFVLQVYDSEKPLAYIYDVGVKPDYQGKGIGKSLIAYLCEYCKQNNYYEAYVEAEADDIEAINFYRKTNYSYEMQATHFTYSFDNI